MSSMFNQATNFNQNLNDWNVSKITDSAENFSFANDSGFANYNQFWPPFGDLQITDRTQLIDYINQINEIGKYNGYLFNEWDVSLLTDMNELFNLTNQTSTFNHNIGGWNVSQVFNMNGMFNQAQAFDQDIG